jgi:KUP system potassium uptake protein
MEKYLSNENELSFWEQLLMRTHFFIKNISLSEASAFGLDTSNVVVEKFPLIVSPAVNINLKRVTKEN